MAEKIQIGRFIVIYCDVPNNMNNKFSIMAEDGAYNHELYILADTTH